MQCHNKLDGYQDSLACFLVGRILKLLPTFVLIIQLTINLDMQQRGVCDFYKLINFLKSDMMKQKRETD